MRDELCMVKPHGVAITYTFREAEEAEYLIFMSKEINTLVSTYTVMLCHPSVTSKSLTLPRPCLIFPFTYPDNVCSLVFYTHDAPHILVGV